MPSQLRSLFLLLAALLPLLLLSPRDTNASALYMNNYGSGWGLWLRGHYFLRETDSDYVVEVERISVEPNREYPQNFEISGFKLAYYFQDRESGEALERDSVAGPPAPYPATVMPSEPLIVEGVTVSIGKWAQLKAQEALILELHVVTTSGASIGVPVGEFFGE